METFSGGGKVQGGLRGACETALRKVTRCCSVTQADATMPVQCVTWNRCRPLVVQSRMHARPGIVLARPVGAVSQPSGAAGRLLLMPCAPETAADGCQETDGRAGQIGSALGRCGRVCACACACACAWCVWGRLEDGMESEWGRCWLCWLLVAQCLWLCRCAWMMESMLDVGCVEPQTSEVGSRPRSRLARASKLAIERRGDRECAPESEPCRWASAMRLFVSFSWCHGY